MAVTVADPAAEPTKEIGNVATAEPAGTETLAGTVTSAGSEEERRRSGPFASAGASRVAVPVMGVPTGAAVGLTVTPVMEDGGTVTSTHAVIPWTLMVILAVPDAAVAGTGTSALHAVG